MIAVVSYDPGWPRLFEAERELLEGVLERWLEGGVHHIGSTAVPGLASKPSIDMMAGVRDLEEARAAYAPLRDVLYESAQHRPGIAHHFEKRPAAGFLRYGLHLTEVGSDLWHERLVFRDSLRADPALPAEYAALKEDLARRHPDDPRAYTTGKRAFVARVLAQHGLRPGRR